MAILTPEELVSAIEAHLIETDQSATAFGRALGDPSLVLELRRGRIPSLALANRIMATIGRPVTKDA